MLREGIAVSSKKDVEMNEMLKLVVPVDERDHTLGPADASVTVLNYGDYQCHDCHRRHKEIQKMVDELTDRVRFVYRHFPLCLKCRQTQGIGCCLKKSQMTTPASKSRLKLPMPNLSG